MAKIELELPEKFIYERIYKIEKDDINLANHLGNDSIVRIANETRPLFFQSFGTYEYDLFKGIGSILADMTYQFKSEGFLGDEIKIEVGVTSVFEYGLQLFMCFTNTKSGKEMVRVQNTLIWFDYKNKKKTPLPEQIRKAIS